MAESLSARDPCQQPTRQILHPAAWHSYRIKVLKYPCPSTYGTSMTGCSTSNVIWCRSKCGKKNKIPPSCSFATYIIARFFFYFFVFFFSPIPKNARTPHYAVVIVLLYTMYIRHSRISRTLKSSNCASMPPVVKKTRPKHHYKKEKMHTMIEQGHQ